ncbi:MAG: DUF459 domain-containing protein [Alphaproteobacteria bacterium]|nr:DUF459 domain-containing protein [Alphaproteobacteria bacterium]
MIKRTLFIAVLCSALASLPPALAQQATPVIGSEAIGTEAAQQDTSNQPYRILIVGDAMGGGMGAGLSRMIAASSNLQVVNRYNETSALSRPDRYDWAASIPNIMQDKVFAAAVVMIGINDRQSIRTATGNLEFNTPEWISAYKANVDAVIDALLAQKVKVVWMGLPPMGDPAYDADMQVISNLQKERAVAKGISFVDLRAPFLGPDGKYTERGADDTGVDRRLRESDGVTFFKMGNNRLGQIALAALKSDVVAKPSSPVISAPTAKADPNAGPMFGQQDQNGETVTHAGAEVAASVKEQHVAAEAAAASSIGIAATPGSTAEKLFTQGIAPPAPKGRFDDFTLAVKQ